MKNILSLKRMILGKNKSFNEVIQSDNFYQETYRNDKLIGKSIYINKLEEFLSDLELTIEEIKELDSISEFYSLDKKAQIKLNRSFGKNSLVKLIGKCLDDDFLTKEEENSINEFGNKLGFTKKEIDQFYSKKAEKIYLNYINSFSKDKRISNDEQNQLNKLISNLKIEESNINLSSGKKSDLEYFRLLWKIENNQLPTIQTNVVMQKNEKAHFKTKGNRISYKTVTKGYKGGSSGVSIRIAKGISYRVGSHKGTLEKENIKLTHPGQLTITNKRIVFTSTEKGFSIPFKSLTNFTVFSDGINFQKNATNYNIEILKGKNLELVAKTLTSSINIFNEEL